MNYARPLIDQIIQMEGIKMRLPDKVALITGGGTGIGRATAELFAKEGAKVAISGRRAIKLEEVVHTITESGGEAIAIPGDITIEEDVKKMVMTPIAHWNRLDILVNNAGVIDRTQIHESSSEKWDLVIDVNVKGIYYISKHAIPEMIKFGDGSIINIASVSGLRGQVDAHAYSAAKGAVVNLTRALAISYGPQNIRVNTVCPALVETAMPLTRLKEGQTWEEMVPIWAQSYPLRRIGQPIDIAYGCLYLASEEASWVTGETLVIDGGLTAQ
ncbi:MAG: SDR family NAD(P)-dependent oxidoreductase [Candidatus Heimdallarchaeota archaeon]